MRTSSPFPYDCVLNGQGFMQARGRDLAVKRRFHSPQQTVAVPSGKLVHLWNGFLGGVGLRRDDGTPEARKMAYSVSAEEDWGGVDTAYGSVFLGPKITDTNVVGLSRPIFTALRFTGDGNYYLAAGGSIFRSVTGTSGWAVVYTHPSAASPTEWITDLVEYQGTNSNPTLYAALTHYGYVTSSDGVTWTLDNAATPRTDQYPLAFYKTTDAGVTYTDYTSDVADLSAGTFATLSALDTKANGDWIIVGAPEPAVGISITIGNANGNASTVAAEYFNGTAWVALTGVTDGTAAAGASLAISGNLTWNRPAADWPRTAVVANTQASAMQLVRLSWSAALDGSTTLTTVKLLYYEEADKFLVAGRVLWKASDRNRLLWTENGGPSALWNATADPVGDYLGDIVGLAAANDSVYLKTTRAFGTLLPDGSSKTYWPSLFSPPSTLDYQAVGSWMNTIYLAHDMGLYAFDTLAGTVQSIGLARLYHNDSELQARAATVYGDRDQFLYAAFYNDTTGRCWLAKTRGETVTGPDGVQYLPWHVISTAAGVQPVSLSGYVDSSGQPQLLMGATNGHTYSFALPLGQNPLDVSSGYAFTTARSYLRLATITGPNPLRPLEAHAWTVVGHGWTPTVGVGFSTRDPASNGAWTAQGDITAGTRARSRIDAAFTGTGLDCRLELFSGSSLITPVVDVLGVDYAQPIDRAEGIITVQVVCGNQVRDQNGRLVPRRAEDWKTVLNTATDTEGPFPMTTKTGDQVLALVQDRREDPLPEAWGWGTGEIITLQLMLTAGPVGSLTWNDLDALALTWNDVDALGLTWDQWDALPRRGPLA